MMVCLYSLIAKRVNASILWERELAYDVNTNSSPLASCINRDANGVIVITKVGPKGTFLSEGGNCILWEIGINGNIVRKVLLKDAGGNIIKTNALAVGPGCAMASDNLGNLLTIGVLNEQRRELTISVILLEHASEPNVIQSDRISDFLISKLIPLRDNTFALIGGQSGNGKYLRIDNQGKIVKEMSFNRGQHERFTGADVIKSDISSLAVVGLSTHISTKDPNESSAENFILIYDSNDKLVQENYFTGEIPGLLYPKICCLDNDDIVTIYKNKSEDHKTRLWARYYTKELKLLWEKEIFAAEKLPNNLPFYFDVISCGSNGFVAAIRRSLKSLEFYFFNADNDKTNYAEYKGLVSTPGFNLVRMNDKTIAIFEEFSGQGKIKDITIKAKVIALD